MNKHSEKMRTEAHQQHQRYQQQENFTRMAIHKIFNVNPNRIEIMEKNKRWQKHIWCCRALENDKRTPNAKRTHTHTKNVTLMRWNDAGKRRTNENVCLQS